MKVMYLVCLMFLLFPSVGNAEIKVLTLRHVSADSVLPMVRQLLSSNGTVSEWENRLIVNSSADEIAEIEGVLRQIDVPPVMLRVTVRTEKRHNQAGKRIGPALAKQGGSEEIAAGDSNRSSGPAPASGWHLSNSVEETEYFLRVRDGGQGFIMIEKSIPYVQEMLVLARRHAGYRQSFDFQVVNAGFWIKPLIEGDSVYLDIRPHLEGFKKNFTGSTGLPTPIELQSLETSVRVPLGRWVDLGGVLREGGDEISRAIVAWKAGNSFRETTFWLKIERQNDRQ